MMEKASLFIANRYGSKKGLLRYYWYGLLQRLGIYSKYRLNTHNEINRLVYICSGNICRSPLGDVYARSLGFESVSFGLHCRGGDEAFEKTLQYGLQQSLPIEEHRSQNISHYEPRKGDLLIVMEPNHLEDLETQFPETPKLLLGFLTDWENVYIHDPFNTNVVFFDRCMKEIEKATLRLIRFKFEKAKRARCSN
ncbi:low molecular weight phosphatase family protein [Alteromonas facilis]|uniref:arsenate-mycothiol transferase ArsC n=1 Tax=Alteromonas facilis TaxID=2048004 RepID=UPI000C28729C|nr:low molecular weight phosphatase family protein [Alteromonas facilis]